MGTLLPSTTEYAARASSVIHDGEGINVGAIMGVAVGLEGIDRHFRDRMDLRPLAGDYHNVLVRVQGARRSYAVGLASGNRLVLYKKAGEYRPIAEVECPWERGRRYRLEVEATGPEIGVAVDGRPLLRWRDREAPYLHGQVGLGVFGGCHAACERVTVVCREDG